MTMTFSAASARLARQVPQTEQEIDQALLALSNLMASMVAARNIEGMAPGTGEMAIQSVGKAIEGLVSASGEMAKAHARLRKIYEEKAGFDLDNVKCASLSSLENEASKAA